MDITDQYIHAQLQILHYRHISFGLDSFYTLPKGSGALMVEVWIGTMALQNLQQYGCQTGNKLKEISRDLNRNSSRFFFQIKMKQCSVADTKTVRSLEFQVVLFLSLIFCRQEEKILFFGSVSGCTCLILSIVNIQEHILKYLIQNWIKIYNCIFLPILCI